MAEDYYLDYLAKDLDSRSANEQATKRLLLELHKCLERWNLDQARETLPRLEAKVSMTDIYPILILPNNEPSSVLFLIVWKLAETLQVGYFIFKVGLVLERREP